MLYKHRQRENAFARKVLFLALAILASLLMILFSSCQKENIIDRGNRSLRAMTMTNGSRTISFEPYWYRWLISIPNPCDSEDVNIDGWISVLTKQSINEDGRYVQSWKYSANEVTATGSISGKLYQLTYEAGQNGSGDVAGGQQYTISIKLKIVSPSGSVLTQTFKQHLVTDADGAIKVFFTDQTSVWDCKH